jgi:hypothetical protein
MFIRSWAVATNLFWAGVLSVTVPPMVGAWGNIGVLVFYAGLNVFSFVMIFFLMPGTDIIHHSAQFFFFFLNNPFF